MSDNSLMLLEEEGIRVVACPHPFKVARVDIVIPVGSSLQDILEIVQPDPVLRAHAHILVNSSPIYHCDWVDVYPFEDDVVTISVVPTGGGGGGGGSSKSPLKAIATIGIIAASLAFGPQVGAFLLPGLTATIGGTLVSTIVGRAVIGGIGMLVSNALIPPKSPTSPGMPTLSRAGGGITESPTLFIEGARNSEQPFGILPVVLGVHRHVPPLLSKTITEVVGEDQHLRMLVAWSAGRVDIASLLIGLTEATTFDDVQIETVEGVSGDPSMTLFPDTVNQENFSILLEQVNGFTIRTSGTGVDELSVDVIFARGLVTFDNSGNRNSRTVSFQIQYRETGTGGAWLTPTFTATTSPTSGITATVTDNKSAAVRHGYRWAVSRAQYDIRMQRTTADNTSTKIFDEVTWATLRSITNEDPDNFPIDIAKTALVVKATNQLSNIIDNLSGIVSSYVLDFTGSSAGWVTGISSNPASLFRHVLQSTSMAIPLADSRIDLDILETWHTFCAANNFEFNQIRDYQVSVWELLTDICIAGRASPTQIDGKWGVVIDQLQTIPSQHFTNKNSWGFEAEKDFPDLPHALRVRFSNRDLDWRQDERIVYADGFTELTATKFEEIDAIGMTDADHVWKFARFNLAQMSLRPEKWFLNVDFEYLVSKRGDLVLLTHDILLVGLASGRIKSLQTDSSGDVTGITVDEILTMEAGKAYGISIRTLADQEIVKTIVLDVGDQTTIVFDSVIPAANAPIIDDLFGFGISGAETIEGLLLSVETQSNISARLTITPYSAAIYTADTGTIPTFDTKLTPQTSLPDVIIIGTRTDESVLRLGAGNTLIPRIGVSHVPINNNFDGLIKAQIRLTSSGLPFAPVTISFQNASEIIIEDVEQGETYDIRLQWTSTDLLPGNFSFSNNITVIGTTNPPNPLSGLTISVYGGTTLLRWNTLEDLDVRFGGEIRFRFSQELSSANASWSASVGIGTSLKGSAVQEQLPLKEGTYLARVFDKGGRASAIVAIDTKQASVLPYADASADVVEETTFSGIHTNTVAVDGILKLIGIGLVDDIAEIDLVTDWDSEGGIHPSGTYEFAAGHDLGSATKVRATTDINMIVTNVIDLIDSRADLIDTWESIDGDVSGEADARVEVRVTDDDPASSGVSYSAYNLLDSAEFNNRGLDYRVLLTSKNTSFNPIISKLQVKVEEI
jgi:hypothetical protein